MSAETTPRGDGSDGDAEDATPDRADLEARVELLEEENRRLRSAYQAAKRSQYRRTALGLALVGALALGGAALFPNARTVLIALGGTGVFAAVLTLYLTPERFVAASVGESVFDAVADNLTAIAAELGLADARVYVPTGDDVRLFVPQRETDDLPDADALDTAFVVGEGPRGLALTPTGHRLFEEFERARSGPPADRPVALARQLADAAIEQFELADRADPESGGDGQVTVGLGDPVYRPARAFDHPVASLVGVGLARGLDTPVTVETRPSDDDRYDTLVTYSWKTEANAEAETA